MWETWVQSLGWEDPLEKEKATHSSILAWRIPDCIVHGFAKSRTRLSSFRFQLGEETGSLRKSHPGDSGTQGRGWIKTTKNPYLPGLHHHQASKYGVTKASNLVLREGLELREKPTILCRAKQNAENQTWRRNIKKNTGQTYCPPYAQSNRRGIWSWWCIWQFPYQGQKPNTGSTPY